MDVYVTFMFLHKCVYYLYTRLYEFPEAPTYFIHGCNYSLAACYKIARQTSVARNVVTWKGNESVGRG